MYRAVYLSPPPPPAPIVPMSSETPSALLSWCPFYRVCLSLSLSLLLPPLSMSPSALPPLRPWDSYIFTSLLLPHSFVYWVHLTFCFLWPCPTPRRSACSPCSFLLSCCFAAYASCPTCNVCAPSHAGVEIPSLCIPLGSCLFYLLGFYTKRTESLGVTTELH